MLVFCFVDCKRSHTDESVGNKNENRRVIYGKFASDLNLKSNNNRAALEHLINSDYRTEGSKIIQIIKLQDGTYELRTENPESSSRGEDIHLSFKNGKWRILEVRFWEE